MNYGTRNKKVSDVLKNYPKFSKPVYQYTLDGKFIKEWQSSKEIERQLGYKHQAISRCCNSKHKSAYGYIWSYTPLN